MRLVLLADRGEFRDRHCLTGHDQHVPGAGVVTGDVETMWVGEAGVFHTQLGRPVVHHPHETIDRSAYVLGYGGGRVIARADHGGAHQRAEGHGLSGHEADLLSPCAGGLLGDHHLIIQIPILQGEEDRHDLGDRGHGSSCVRVGRGQHHVRGLVIDDPSRRTDKRRPVVRETILTTCRKSQRSGQSGKSECHREEGG
jgi:hypothetical protein